MLWRQTLSHGACTLTVFARYACSVVLHLCVADHDQAVQLRLLYFRASEQSLSARRFAVPSVTLDGRKHAKSSVEGGHRVAQSLSSCAPMSSRMTLQQLSATRCTLRSTPESQTTPSGRLHWDSTGTRTVKLRSCNARSRG